MPEPAQITLRAPSADVLAEPRVLAALTACFAALAAVICGLSEATLMADLVALVTPSVLPDLAVWTTRSPPRTGRPA